jgi:hypothetical protein
MPHLFSRGTNPTSGQTMDIYENPSESHYEAQQQQQPLYYMEDGFNGPMLKVAGYGELISAVNVSQADVLLLLKYVRFSTN